MPSKKSLNIAVVNPGDIVAKELIAIIQERNLQINSIDFIAPEGTDGKIIHYKEENRLITSIFKHSFVDIDIAFFILPTEQAINTLPLTLNSNTYVIDILGSLINSKNTQIAFPEINLHSLTLNKNRIISVPNSLTIQLSSILYPIQQQFGLKRVIASIYQSVSGKGESYIEELAKQTVSLINFEGLDQYEHIQRIAFNCIPETESIDQDGYSEKENNIVFQIKKLLDQDNLKISVNLVTVPVFHCDSLYINIETVNKIPKFLLNNLFKNIPNQISTQDNNNPLYPTPLSTANQDKIFVSKIKEDRSSDNGINIWCVMDNLRNGPAKTAVKIAEELLDMGCFS
jgi:aspartate-semialdehyde dehydrogenase